MPDGTVTTDLDWRPNPGHWDDVPFPRYIGTRYRGMECELYFSQRSERWGWSFYDSDSPDPELAVAREDGYGSREGAEADLLDYIDSYLHDLEHL